MRVGEVVGARFELESLAAEGGMGAIWRARDRLDGATVAVKLLQGTSAASSERFAREASVLAELRHPAIVRYLAHGELSTSRWLAMEWLEGEDLHTRLARSRLTMEESVALVRRIADALGVAHAHGVVHRDVKPSNIVLVSGDVTRAKLLDFGIARRESEGDDRLARLTQTGVVVGTPAYMAPEQARGHDDIDARADVFSLGCLLFTCITGRRVFLGDEVMAVLAKVLLEEAPSARSLCPEVPRSLDALITSMLAKERTHRPKDGAAVAAALGSIAAEAEVASTAVRRTPPTDTEALGPREQRIVSVVAIRLPAFAAKPSRATYPINALGTTSPAGTPFAALLDTLRTAVAPYGALLELADGSVLTVLSGREGRGGATDRAALAARCALAMHEAIGGVDGPAAGGTSRTPVDGPAAGGTSRTPVDGPAAGGTSRTLVDGLASVLATGRGVASPSGDVGALLGEAIDRAASLLRLPASPHVRIDDATAGLLDARFDFGAAPDEGLLLRAVTEALDDTRTLLGKPTICVGRERELATLEAFARECAEESVARAVLVTGAAGIGKSRLRHELLRRIAARDANAADVWFARGDPIHAGSAFMLIAQALRRLTGAQMGEALESQQRKIKARVARHVPADAATHVAETIGEMLGAGFPDEGSERLRTARADPIVMGDQMRRAVEDLLDAELRAHPVILVLEDLQWGDLPTVTLLDGALRWLRDRPLMVLAFARDEVREKFPRLWAERGVHDVRLGELGKRASERLVRAALGDAIGETTLARIVTRAEGNAFYLEELIRAVDAGRHDALPSTLLAMVSVRLEALPADARQVLRAGSVFGEVFWRGAVEALLGGSTARSSQVGEWLDHLCEREVLVRTHGVPRFPDQLEYVFRHALVRETSYAMLTEADRLLGHRLAAEWLETVGERGAVVVAEHFEQGGVPERAVPQWLRGAELALEGDDFEAAIARAERGIACGARGVTCGALRGVEATAHYWRGETASTVRAADEARALLPVGSIPWADAMSFAAVAKQRLGHIDELVTVCQSLLTPLEEGGGAQDAILTAAARVSITLRHAAKSTLADTLLEACAPRVASSRPAALTATLHVAYAYQALESGDAASFVDHIQAAIVDYVAAGDPRRAASQRGDVGYGQALLGAYEKAERTLRDSLVEGERMGLRSIVATAQNNLGMVLGRLGRLDQAREVEETAARSFHAHGNLRLEGGSRIYLAEIHLRARHWGDAEREAKAALSLLATVPPFRPYALATLARVLLAQRNPEALARSHEAMLALGALGGSAEEGEAIVRLAHAECLQAFGSHAEALTVIDAARTRLLERTQKISSEAARKSFLERIDEHARTLELASAWRQRGG